MSHLSLAPYSLKGEPLHYFKLLLYLLIHAAYHQNLIIAERLFFQKLDYLQHPGHYWVSRYPGTQIVYRRSRQ